MSCAWCLRYSNWRESRSLRQGSDLKFRMYSLHPTSYTDEATHLSKDVIDKLIKITEVSGVETLWSKLPTICCVTNKGVCT